MAVNERRLTGRDVLAKTFVARTKRGYDPVEVDAYLELVAAQIDMLHGDVVRAAEQADGSTGGAMHAAGVDDRLEALAAELDAISAERDAFRAERAELEELNNGLLETRAALEAENQQLRAQVTATAPPPPGDMGSSDEKPAHAIEVPTVDAETLPAAVADERATEESYELVLRMARRSAEETIAEAHARADEIVADANFTAAQISRESDRKAFEAANKMQAELAAMGEQIDHRKLELERLDSLSAQRRDAMRELASQLLVMAEDDARSLTTGGGIGDEEIVDVRASAESSEHAL